mgnify:CR=1 FL=1
MRANMFIWDWKALKIQRVLNEFWVQLLIDMKNWEENATEGTL